MSQAGPSHRPLTRQSLGSAALRLIDRVGLARFSMRKLGASLGVDPMAAYRHVADQEELFDAVSEALLAEMNATALPWDRPWGDLLEAFAQRMREVLMAHPNAVIVFASRPVRSTESIDLGVRAIQKLMDAGFEAGIALELIRCLRDYIIGNAVGEAIASGAGSRSRKPAKGSPEYNVLAEGADAETADGHFALGLAALLEGFARHIRS